jgi:hypothetical protein
LDVLYLKDGNLLCSNHGYDKSTEISGYHGSPKSVFITLMKRGKKKPLQWSRFFGIFVIAGQHLPLHKHIKTAASVVRYTESFTTG